MNQPSPKSTYHVLGVMSGTSLDGLDLAIVKLEVINGKWSYELLSSESLEYSIDWKHKLKNAFSLDNQSLDLLDAEFGDFIGESIHNLIADQNIILDFIASHGHTVFHQPGQGITVQIGDAKAIYGQTNIPVISNFRALDVSLGGQGAPLVPIGDRLLFHEYNYCLNLGGIANISFEEESERRAYDICPFNMTLNYLTMELGLPFDEGGKIAQSGALDTELFNQLNDISYCQAAPPKSLGYEEFLKFWKPVLDDSKASTINKLRTVVEHCALQIGKTIASAGDSVLVTGGGAFNNYFISRLKEITNNEVVIPIDTTIEFKEAIVFALLGALKYRGDSNCLASVTGASQNNSGGVMYGF
jgi:anhydro-N-acetylmuramic acid kinase